MRSRKKKYLIYDHLLRRDEKSEGLENYPEEVKECHEAYVQKVRESMEAKVEVVYGTKVKKRMLQKQAFKFDPLRLWGEYEDICIFLDCESNYSNAQQEHQYRRVIIFAIHPQRFFYSPEGEPARQDKFLTVAAKISRVNSIERYYEDQKWKAIVPPGFSNMAKRKLFGIPSKQSQNDEDRSNASEKADDLIPKRPASRWRIGILTSMGNGLSASGNSGKFFARGSYNGNGPRKSPAQMEEP